MTLQTLNKSNRMSKMMVVCAMIAICLACAIVPAYADALSSAMEYVTNILATAAKYVGAVISAWGIFQIIMAMRREDSEAISKQIMTVVVGAALVAFGFAAPELINSLAATQ